MHIIELTQIGWFTAWLKDCLTRSPSLESQFARTSGVRVIPRFGQLSLIESFGRRQEARARNPEP